MSLNLNIPNVEVVGTYVDWALKLMVEDHAFILSHPNMPSAALFTKSNGKGELAEVGKLARTAVERLYLLGLIELAQNGKVERYEISQKGRLAHERGEVIELPLPVPARVKPEAPSNRGGAHQTPLEILARKVDRNGVRYLNARLIAAAAQLREDYEIAEIDERVTQNWKPELLKYLEVADGASAVKCAKARFARAMFDLGDGLGDIAYRVCCLEEGLETAENWLGWSARSAKVVLRIALIRLADHYEIPQINKERIF